MSRWKDWYFLLFSGVWLHMILLVTIVMHLRSFSSGGTAKFLTWTWTWTGVEEVPTITYWTHRLTMMSVRPRTASPCRFRRLYGDGVAGCHDNITRWRNFLMWVCDVSVCSTDGRGRSARWRPVIHFNRRRLPQAGIITVLHFTIIFRQKQNVNRNLIFMLRPSCFHVSSKRWTIVENWNNYAYEYQKRSLIFLLIYSGRS